MKELVNDILETADRLRDPANVGRPQVVFSGAAMLTKASKVISRLMREIAVAEMALHLGQVAREAQKALDRDHSRTNLAEAKATARAFDREVERILDGERVDEPASPKIRTMSSVVARPIEVPQWQIVDRGDA